MTARREGTWICLDFPAIPARPAAIPEGLPKALGAQVCAAHRGWESGYLVELEDEEAIRGLRPDFGRLQAFGPIIATARATSAAAAGSGFDFVSRVFAPGLGINEDPVTGVAHCCLGPFWAQRLGKTDLLGRQLSRRGGTVRVRVRGVFPRAGFSQCEPHTGAPTTKAS